MRDKVHLFHYLHLTLESGSVKVVEMQIKLINPEAMRDACMIRILGPGRSILMEGRCTVNGLREVLDSNSTLEIAKNASLIRSESAVLLTLKHPHPILQASASASGLQQLVETLWIEYSDF